MINNKLIVITADYILPDEVALWINVLNAGVYKLHIRKPNASRQIISPMVAQIPVELRKNVVMHHHTDIADRFGLGGVHLRFRESSSGNNRAVSCSVHSWEDARTIKNDYDYYFMSPVFDSISKSGYKKNDNLTEVPADLPNKKVYALGGVTASNAGLALQYGYYGVAALGYVWEEPNQAVGRVKELLRAMTKQIAAV